jgi:hypothetical protein
MNAVVVGQLRASPHPRLGSFGKLCPCEWAALWEACRCIIIIILINLCYYYISIDTFL